MANNVHTIIIRDETRAKQNGSINQNQVKSDGTIEQKKVTKPHIHKGRPRKQGSVEHNRYSRIWNSSMNKITGGYWEKANRFGKATTGVLTNGSMVGVAIIGQFIFNEIYKEYKSYLKQIEEQNEKDTLKIRVGAVDYGNSYNVSRNFFTGKTTYKTNK